MVCIENEGLKNMLNSETSRRMVTSLSNGHSDERFGKPLMENGDCTFLAPPKCKQYKVSAIRDFPEECGRFASRVDPETPVQTIDPSSKNENLVVSSHMYGPPLANSELANVQLVGIEAALEDTELTRTAKAVNCEVVLSGGSKFLSSDGNVSGCGACPEKAVTTRCFPPRRLSAVRDFPPLCGQNASHLSSAMFSNSNGECLNGISSLDNKRMVQQNIAVDDKPLKRATATDTKEVEKSVQDGYAYNGRLAGIVQADSQGDATKKVKKLDVFEPSTRTQLPLENVREKCNTISKESSHHQVEINSKIVDKVGNGGAVQFEVTSGQEIIIYPELQSLGTRPLEMSNCQHEVKGGFDGLRIVSHKRVAVLGLMSESECPWRHGRGSSKFNLIRGKNKSKGKKVDFLAQQDMSKTDIKRKESPNHVGKKPLKKRKGNAALEKKDSHYCNENKEFPVIQKSHGFNVKVRGHHNNDSSVTRISSYISGQPGLAWKEVKNSKKFKTREHPCVNDISYGKELIPICAVNTIDDQKPPLFKYITSNIYPNWCNPIPPKGCDCTNGCFDSEKCSCAVKNGGEIPYNHDGAIVVAKPLVYECGPSCKCTSCYNRVSQHGIKIQLEIFKTETRGWGVRSPNSISSGSFICEYTGELLDEKEAEQRTGNDEYLFDIGNNNSNHALWDGLSTVMPNTQSISCEIVEDIFTIDALEYGNVGRFINHSCSPNLYAQDVLYDHDDKRIPHVMLFAAEDIPPLQELTYDYNYKIDQVHDSSGNIKRKDCYCGSLQCTGRMY